MKVHGRVVWPEGALTLSEPIFVGRVTPVLGCLSSEQMSGVPDTMMFYTTHSLDLKFTSMEHNGEFHLGYEREELVDKSWYHLAHPDYIPEMTRKHLELVQKGLDTAKSLVIRVQTKSGCFVWMHILMRFATPSFASLGSDNLTQEIVCLSHVIDEKQAFDTISRGKMEERFNGLHCAFESSLGSSQRESYVPTVVVEEEFLDHVMSGNQPINCNHEELMQRIRQKAQGKQNKRPRPDNFMPTDYMKYDDINYSFSQSSLAPYMVNFTGAEFGGKKSKVGMQQEFKNEGLGEARPFTPPSSEDSCSGIDYGSLTYTAPTPEFMYTPPYSPSGSSFVEESSAMTSQQDDMSFFDGTLPSNKQHVAVKRKREDSLSDDLPELDHCLVEHFLLGVESPSPSNFQLNSLNISKPSQFPHNMAAVSSSVYSATTFQPVQANHKYNRSGAVKSLPRPVYESPDCSVPDFGRLYGDEAGHMELINTSELFEAFESPYTGLALHSF